MDMPEAWTGNIVGRMHNEGISYGELAAEMGITKGYVCMILNGKRKPQDIQEKMENALSSILQRREAAED